VRVAVADLAAYEIFLSQRVMTIPRVKNVTSRFTMKTVKPAP
jgi:DNA-binding Lrp family transcriptional regulator